MASRKLILGSAGAAALSLRVARSLHARWRQLPRGARRRPEQLAIEAPKPAPEGRGEPDYARAAASLRAANDRLAATLVETTESNPDVSATDVAQLKGDLRRALERLANADVKASRTGLSAPPRG